MLKASWGNDCMFHAVPVLRVPDHIIDTEPVQRKHRCDIVCRNVEYGLECIIMIIILDLFSIHFVTILNL